MNREDVLKAVKEASKLSDSHRDSSRTSIDLASVAESLDIPVMHRPLDGLWGGAVTVEGKDGAIIKSDLARNLQRFTLAHEIGHVVLGHKTQIDESVGTYQRATNPRNKPSEEICADTFASELLAPQWLIKRNAVRRGWAREMLREPKQIYQMSLLLGVSFTATCWALVEHGLLTKQRAEQFNEQKGIVKDQKIAAAPESVSRNPHADVWSLSENDAGVRLEASQDDLFVVQLEEQSSSGYRWDITDGDAGAQIAYDDSEFGERYGSSSQRTFGIKLNSTRVHSLTFKQRRPWSNETLNELVFWIDNRGREKKGLPRMVKEASLGRATA